MKTKLFLVPVAALALTACSNDTVVDEVISQNQPREIAFAPLSQVATRAAIDGTTFPTTLDMKVAAYQVEATGGTAGVYFDATTFKYQYAGSESNSTANALYWGGETAKFWPLTPAYINFLAIANANADNSTGVTWGTDKADQVTIVMSDNSTAQRDLVYAIGNGEVTQSGNVLTFPAKVDMEFKHAQAWIDFKVKASSTAEQAITVNSITLTGAKYVGTYTVTHTNYDAKTGQSVAGAWSALGTVADIAVPNWTAATLSTEFVTVGYGLMIVPDDAATGDFTSFTINYSYDGKTYDYTYTPASRQVEQGKHYIYEITFKLHEIFINPTVEDWVDMGEFIDIPSHAVGTPWNYGEISGKASSYKFLITGLTGADPTAAVTDGSATFATDPSITAGVVSFAVANNFTNAVKNYSITVTDAGEGNSGKNSVITFSQAKYTVPYVENGVATVVIPNTAGTYYFDITGITDADNYLIAEGDTGTDFVTGVTPTSNTAVGAGGSLGVSVTVTSSTGNSRPIILKNNTPENKMTIIIKQQ